MEEGSGKGGGNGETVVPEEFTQEDPEILLILWVGTLDVKGVKEEGKGGVNEGV